MAQPASPHCPACAAPLPFLERQQIVTCEFCGTDCNADYQATPATPPRSPPLADDRTFSADYEDHADWESGAYIHAVLTAADPSESIRLAQGGNGYLAGEDLLLWSPALTEGIIAAERAGHTVLADELTVLLRDGGSARKYSTHSPDSPAARAAAEQRRIRGSDFAPAQRVDPKHAWTILQLADRLLRELPESHAGLIALSAAGPASLRRLLEVASAAEAAGNAERLAEALACAHRILVETTDDWAFGVVFDVATYLLPRLPAQTQQGVLDSLGDLADLSVDEPGREYGREWRGPDDTLTVLLLLADDLLHEHPALGERLMEAIVKGADRHPNGRYYWVLGLHAVPSARGRAACLDAYERVYKQRAEENEDDLLDEVRRRSDAPNLKPFLKGELPAALRLARARDGQAPCPSCGRALTLDRERLIIVCDHCGQTSRVAREVRTVRRVLDPDSLELHTWTPERLVSTMLQTEDEALRLAIAEELASATSDGSRFVELAPALVTYLLAESIPEKVADLLKDGIESMLRFRDQTFLDALFEAIRAQAFSEEGSINLLRALEHAGPTAAPLLFDLCDQVTADSDKWSSYTLSARASAFHVLQKWAAKDLAAVSDFLLDRMVISGPALSDELPSYLGRQVFDERPFDAIQDRLVRFIDDHTDPAKFDWHKGISPYGKELPVPHYSWSAQDIAEAEQRLGLKWAQGGELDINKITASIPTMTGSPVTLRQIQMLFMQVDSCWQPPATARELQDRLTLAAEVRHDSTRVLVLGRILEPPSDLTDAARAPALAALSALPTSEHVEPWKALVVRTLTAQPGDTPAAKEHRRGRDWEPPKHARLQWRLAQARHSLGSLVRRLLRR